MHFVYALLTNGEPRTKAVWSNIHVFTFGTRLTNVTRLLRQKDPDIALEKVGKYVRDWDGGTKIGFNLEAFNRDWSRRVLGSNAVVLFVSDGLERGEVQLLKAQIKRLRLSCGHLIWLNPLLRFDEFKPLASGVKAILPHVDRMAHCHNIKSLAELSHILSAQQSHRNRRQSDNVHSAPLNTAL